MHPINRRGQKVVCIMEIDIETPAGEIYTGRTPVLDQVYTVTGFGETGMLAAVAEPIQGIDVGVTVAEIPSIQGRHHRTGVWQTLAWPLAMFQPADYRTTDISDLIEIGKKWHHDHKRTQVLADE